MAPRVIPARGNSWTAWRSSMLSILRGPPGCRDRSLPGGRNVPTDARGEDRIQRKKRSEFREPTDVARDNENVITFGELTQAHRAKPPVSGSGLSMDPKRLAELRVVPRAGYEDLADHSCLPLLDKSVIHLLLQCISLMRCKNAIVLETSNDDSRTYTYTVREIVYRVVREGSALYEVGE